MKKFWMVLALDRDIDNGESLSGTVYSTKEAAEDTAKRWSAARENQEYSYVILEATTVAKAPVPKIDLVPLA